MELDHVFWHYLNEKTQKISAVRSLFAWSCSNNCRDIRELHKFRQNAGFSHLTGNILEAVNSYNRAEGYRLYKKLLQRDIFMLTYIDNQYPVILRSIYNPPGILYAMGSTGCLDLPSVGIVGSRKCSSYGKETAMFFSRELAQKGYAVISGLALGIDTWAHRGALLAGGTTISVLGSGFNRLYPQANKGLVKEIAKRGLVLSEYPPDLQPRKMHFPERNRIISGLSEALLVVEASEKSGSLITAGFALDEGRDVYAVPGRIDCPTSRGTNLLIADGAIPALETEDITG